MKTIRWLLVAGVGFGTMMGAYFGWHRIDRRAPWATAMMVLGGPGDDAPPQGGGFDTVAAKVRLLAVDELAQAMTKAAGPAQHHLAAQLAEKLVLAAPAEIGIGDEFLKGGRMPIAGRGEVIAGCRAAHRELLAVAGQELKVVGLLRRDVALFADSYLAPPDDSLAELFEANDGSVREALLIRFAPKQLRDRELRDRLKETYPRQQFARVGSTVRVDRGPYYLYVAGQVLLLLGGSGALIGIYLGLAARQRGGVLRDVFAEMQRRRRLLWSMHLAYFGLAIAGALVVYEFAPLQWALLGAAESEVSGGKGVLGTAGKAYGSGIIPWAALVTFLINFLLGSFAMITLPSLVLPGSGALLAALRAVMWGLLLGPTITALSVAMLPHSWTLLLEGEAYILATFFAVLVPTYLCQPSLGGSAVRRYGRAVWMNLKGNLLVAIVLLIAACYEAIEVILLKG